MSQAKSLKKSIYLVGPHSTGKSTLTKALQNHYGPNTKVIYEVARKVLKEKGYSASTIGSPQGFQMQKDIFMAQYEAEHVLMQENISFISDRAAVDPVAYCKMYPSGPEQKESWKLLLETSEWKLMSERYRDQEKSFVVLMEPIKQFLTDDGTRMMPLDWNEWLDFGKTYAEILEHENVPCKVLGENCINIQDRVETVVSWIHS